MLAVGRLSALFLFFLAALLTGATARSPFSQARSGLLSSKSEEFRTNGERLAAGLTPLKPRQFFTPSRVARTIASPLPAVNGRILVRKAGSGTVLGYVSSSVDTSGRYNINSGSNSASHLKVRVAPTSTSTSSELAVALVPASGAYPQLGFAGSNVRLQGSTYNLLTATKETNPGSAPSIVGNSIGGNSFAYSESSIWTYNSNTKTLSATWVNPAPSRNTVATEFYASAPGPNSRPGILQLRSGSNAPTGYQKVTFHIEV
ncbi:hypothetical protein CVT25_002628 [Psilocybe cyanescens]|uniref:Uncharacterized protein n=1 Tax=Psilocybe cyanescens TaxID=93625 RepID=A0A409WLR9_PSICY|nr:hypothetical protein CVT25_002628 [Psilocybe cyanescens]